MPAFASAEASAAPNAPATNAAGAVRVARLENLLRRRGSGMAKGLRDLVETPARSAGISGRKMDRAATRKSVGNGSEEGQTTDGRGGVADVTDRSVGQWRRTSPPPAKRLRHPEHPIDRHPPPAVVHYRPR